MANQAKQLLCAVMMIGLTACANSMSGYGGQTKFNCNDSNINDPRCASITRNYRASISGALNPDINSTQNTAQFNKNQGIVHQAIESGMPIRSVPETVRIWIAPYMDTDGDLKDQSYAYVVLNDGKWQIEHNQQQIMNEFRPVRLLGSGHHQNSHTENKNDSITVRALDGKLDGLNNGTSSDNVNFQYLSSPSN